MIDHRAHRFGGEAAAPVARSEPMSDFGRVFQRIDAASANHDVVMHDQEIGFALALVRARDEMLGVGNALGKGNAGGILRDAAIVGENRNRLHVLVTRRARHEPPSLKDGDGNTAFSPCRRNDVFRQGHLMGSCKETEKGSRHPVSPFSKPIRVRRFDCMPADLV